MLGEMYLVRMQRGGDGGFSVAVPEPQNLSARRCVPEGVLSPTIHRRGACPHPKSCPSSVHEFSRSSLGRVLPVLLSQVAYTRVVQDVLCCLERFIRLLAVCAILLTCKQS